MYGFALPEIRDHEISWTAFSKDLAHRFDVGGGEGVARPQQRRQQVFDIYLSN